MKGQIEKRGDGVYRLRWYDGRKDGKRRYNSETVRGTLKQAQKRMREVLTMGDRGRAMPSPARIPTLRDYVETWKQGHDVAELRPRTLVDYMAQLERHVLPKLGDVRLDALHAARIGSELIAPLRAEGKSRTAQIVLAILSKIMGAAALDPSLGLYGNPCSGVKAGAARRNEIKPLDDAERAAFREAIRGTKHEALWLLMMLTGLGPGEALGLGWEHIDLDAGTVQVARTLEIKGRKIVNDTKRPSRKRVVPLVPELRAMLRERWMAAGRPAEGLVFPNDKGNPISLDNLRARYFWPALEAAKITRRVRIYDLRHGFATAALEAGDDVKTVSVLMGHSSTTITQNVYQHVSEKLKRETTERIGRHLLGRD